MHIFRINIWWMLLVFTLPALLFSQNPYIISILYFIFFALYFFQLSTINKSKKGILLRNKVECILLLIIFSVYPLSILFDKQISLSESLKTIFSILYFLIFIDFILMCYCRLLQPPWQARHLSAIGINYHPSLPGAHVA